MSNFLELFKKDVVIIIGENQYKIANEIAEYLREKTGNKPIVRKYSEIKDLGSYNLIIIGDFNSNLLLRKIFANPLDTNIMEIRANPWNKERHALLIVGDKKGIDIMKQILLSNKLKRIKVSKIYGPYDGWHPSLPPSMEGFPNPVALYCKKVGYCGSENCNRLDFMAGICDEEYTYCSRTGIVTIKNYCRFNMKCGICILSNGKICYEFDYAMGACK